MNVKQIMNEPITISEESSMYDVLRKIIDSKISRVLVENKNGSISKIITEKDLGFFLLNEKTPENLDAIPSSIISKNLIVIPETTSISQAAKIMLERNIGSVGVESGSKTIGIITKTDLIKFYYQNLVGSNKVGDLMSVAYVSINENAFIYDVILKMIQEKVSRLIINDDNNYPKGILSFRDVFDLAVTLGERKKVIDNQDPSISVIFSRRGFLSKEGFGSTIKANEVMTKRIVSVDYNDDVVTACTEMLENNINAVGVLINGKLSGVLSKTDIMKGMSA